MEVRVIANRPSSRLAAVRACGLEAASDRSMARRYVSVSLRALIECLGWMAKSDE
jgi:hypothetical protein